MDDNFNGQKDILIAIKKEIKLLHQQVDYLIRNEKNLELLDLDVMMNRTHKIYDLMCGMEIGNEETGAEDEVELPVDLDEIKGLFGIEEKEEEELEDLEELEGREELEKEERDEENEDAYFIEEAEDVTDEESDQETDQEKIIEELVQEERPTQEEGSDASERRDLDTQSFFLNFEPVEEVTEEIKEETVIETTIEEEDSSVFTTGDEIEMTIPHLDIPEEETLGETLEEVQKENPVGISEEVPEEEIAYEPVVIGDMEEKEDGGFELESPETLGERLQQQQDPTLADKLQHSVLNSLQSAIGINDKFLFVNELFNGSMEKYNRSIANLDDLKTLNGALIYLNELRIELQWNSSNEAYKKLLELVHRKFGA